MIAVTSSNERHKKPCASDRSLIPSMQQTRPSDELACAKGIVRGA